MRLAGGSSSGHEDVAACSRPGTDIPKPHSPKRCSAKDAIRDIILAIPLLVVAAWGRESGYAQRAQYP